ncbi:MAG: hypothetical protein M1825_002035 [Sarcosagium campestre]|nr:MAG: hypothetical protein M1825_002035 [Sarcosagium campestre]
MLDRPKRNAAKRAPTPEPEKTRPKEKKAPAKRAPAKKAPAKRGRGRPRKAEKEPLFKAERNVDLSDESDGFVTLMTAEQFERRVRESPLTVDPALCFMSGGLLEEGVPGPQDSPMTRSMKQEAPDETSPLEDYRSQGEVEGEAVAPPLDAGEPSAKTNPRKRKSTAPQCPADLDPPSPGRPLAKARSRRGSSGSLTTPAVSPITPVDEDVVTSPEERRGLFNLKRRRVDYQAPFEDIQPLPNKELTRALDAVAERFRGEVDRAMQRWRVEMDETVNRFHRSLEEAARRFG